ncbi:hypothetical protein FA95DRAFT_1577359 [Auriscalpium vulgare]|uniref:Uncharacterized protein n=1 Tax=Auriscalpium vulgare TaxID=40419 RepID=A0ACB8R6W3_9AGAM|nr:hypothetical protein FA95DRAFT_1577359 [Auriscalpium vulgare]
MATTEYDLPVDAGVAELNISKELYCVAGAAVVPDRTTGDAAVVPDCASKDIAGTCCGSEADVGSDRASAAEHPLNAAQDSTSALMRNVHFYLCKTRYYLDISMSGLLKAHTFCSADAYLKWLVPFLFFFFLRPMYVFLEIAIVVVEDRSDDFGETKAVSAQFSEDYERICDLRVTLSSGRRKNGTQSSSHPTTNVV